MPHDNQNAQDIRASAHCHEAPGHVGGASVRAWWEAAAAAALYGVALTECGFIEPMGPTGLLALMGGAG